MQILLKKFPTLQFFQESNFVSSGGKTLRLLVRLTYLFSVSYLFVWVYHLIEKDSAIHGTKVKTGNVSHGQISI